MTPELLQNALVHLPAILFIVGTAAWFLSWPLIAWFVGWGIIALSSKWRERKQGISAGNR